MNILYKNNKDSISLVDLGKIIAILIVIMIHTDAFGDWPIGAYVFNKFVKLYAVPFFFVCSGYFLGNKINISTSTTEYREYILNYGKRLITPFMFWGIINFSIEIVVNLSKGISINRAFLSQIHSLLVTSPGRALWYVQAILIMLLILYISCKKSYRVFLFILFGLITFTIPILRSLNNLGFSSVQTLLDIYFRFFITEHNFLFYGVFFLAGMIISDKRIISKVNGHIAILCASMALLLNIFGTQAFNKNFSPVFSRVSALLFSVNIFIFLFNTDAWYSKNFSLKLRDVSTVFYFTHIFIKYGVQFVSEKCLRVNSNLFVFLMTIILLILYYIAFRYLKLKSSEISRLLSKIY